MSDALDNARAEMDQYRQDHPDPDGMCDGQCGIALSATLEALIAEHERLTAPPTNDERETLSGYRAILVKQARAHADDLRRYDDMGEVVATLVEMANLLARRQGPVTVTDEMVEKAAERMHMRASGFEGRKAWADTTDRIRQGWRDAARDALTAALSPDGNTEGNDR